MSKPTRIIKTAKEIVRVRLQTRGLASHSDRRQIGNFQSDGGVKTNDLIQELAEMVGIEAECFRPDDQLGEVLRVRRAELPADLQPLLDDVGLRDVVFPFGIDLVDLVERRLGANRSLLKGAAFQPPPRDEDEWVERINAMTVRELSSAFTS